MPPVPPEEPVPLFVRLPRREARRLHRVAFERGISKRELVTLLVRRHLGEPEEFTIPVAPPDADVVVGHHNFTPEPAAEVLTLEQAAALLQVSEQAVTELATQGKLPGRKIGDAWRFSRAALVAWLADGDVV